MNVAPEAGTTRPMLRAGIARGLRKLAVVRGWQSMVNKLVPQHDGAFTIRVTGSGRFAGNIASFVDRQVYLFGGYEPDLIRTFLAVASRRGTILDVGANCGTHSMAFARAFKSVIAFEPNPKLWGQFERNMALNGLDNVRLHKIGLADRDADLVLQAIDKPNQGLGTFSTEDQYDLPLRPIANCTVRHAGQYLAEIGVTCVDAVKIDVQGYEPEVLRGLSEILRRDHPLIWCEIGAGTLTKVHAVADLQTLVPFPFRCFKMASASRWRNDVVRLREFTSELPFGDYLIVPSGDSAT
jgi:methyltransferase, FkbM family